MLCSMCESEHAGAEAYTDAHRNYALQTLVHEAPCDGMDLRTVARWITGQIRSAITLLTLTGPVTTFETHTGSIAALALQSVPSLVCPTPTGLHARALTTLQRITVVPSAKDLPSLMHKPRQVMKTRHSISRDKQILCPNKRGDVKQGTETRGTASSRTSCRATGLQTTVPVLGLGGLWGVHTYVLGVFGVVDLRTIQIQTAHAPAKTLLSPRPGI